MDAKVDSKGFELQATSPPSNGSSANKNGEKKKIIPTEAPKIPQNGSSGKAPAKPSKSSTLPANAGNTNINSNVESGQMDKGAEARGGGGLSLNTGYFKSWQAWLKIMKTLCLIAMMITLATSINGISKKLPKIELYKPIWESLKTLKFGVALSALGLLLEISTFFIYLLGANAIVNKYLNFGVVLMVCHSVMLLLVFAAPIALNVKKWTGPSVSCFIAFDLITVAGYTLEIYFNAVWLKTGPELACLPCF